MTTRYRIIQYVGTDADIDELMARSINGTFKPGNVVISAWEAQHGDIVESRAGLPEWRPAPQRAGDKADGV